MKSPQWSLFSQPVTFTPWLTSCWCQHIWIVNIWRWHVELGAQNPAINIYYQTQQLLTSACLNCEHIKIRQSPTQQLLMLTYTSWLSGCSCWCQHNWVGSTKSSRQHFLLLNSISTFEHETRLSTFSPVSLTQQFLMSELGARNQAVDILPNSAVSTLDTKPGCQHFLPSPWLSSFWCLNWEQEIKLSTFSLTQQSARWTRNQAVNIYSVTQQFQLLMSARFNWEHKIREQHLLPDV